MHFTVALPLQQPLDLGHARGLAVVSQQHAEVFACQAHLVIPVHCVPRVLVVPSDTLPHGVLESENADLVVDETLQQFHEVQVGRGAHAGSGVGVAYAHAARVVAVGGEERAAELLKVQVIVATGCAAHPHFDVRIRAREAQAFAAVSQIGHVNARTVVALEAQLRVLEVEVVACTQTQAEFLGLVVL